jgi:hypothetical protein
MFSVEDIGCLPLVAAKWQSWMPEVVVAPARWNILGSQAALR